LRGVTLFIYVFKKNTTASSSPSEATPLDTKPDNDANSSRTQDEDTLSDYHFSLDDYHFVPRHEPMWLASKHCTILSAEHQQLTVDHIPKIMDMITEEMGDSSWCNDYPYEPSKPLLYGLRLPRDTLMDLHNLVAIFSVPRLTLMHNLVTHRGGSGGNSRAANKYWRCVRPRILALLYHTGLTLCSAAAMK
jgi:hypothetical protein